MTKKITKIGAAIKEYVLSSFDTEYIHYVFGGVIDVDDLVDQVILECIKKMCIILFLEVEVMKH